MAIGKKLKEYELRIGVLLGEAGVRPGTLKHIVHCCKAYVKVER